MLTQLLWAEEGGRGEEPRLAQREHIPVGEDFNDVRLEPVDLQCIATPHLALILQRFVLSVLVPNQPGLDEFKLRDSAELSEYLPDGVALLQEELGALRVGDADGRGGVA